MHHSQVACTQHPVQLVSGNYARHGGKQLSISRKLQRVPNEVPARTADRALPHRTAILQSKQLQTRVAAVIEG